MTHTLCFVGFPEGLYENERRLARNAASPESLGHRAGRTDGANSEYGSEGSRKIENEVRRRMNLLPGMKPVTERYEGSAIDTMRASALNYGKQYDSETKGFVYRQPAYTNRFNTGYNNYAGYRGYGWGNPYGSFGRSGYANYNLGGYGYGGNVGIFGYPAYSGYNTYGNGFNYNPGYSYGGYSYRSYNTGGYREQAPANFVYRPFDKDSSAYPGRPSSILDSQGTSSYAYERVGYARFGSPGARYRDSYAMAGGRGAPGMAYNYYQPTYNEMRAARQVAALRAQGRQVYWNGVDYTSPSAYGRAPDSVPRRTPDDIVDEDIGKKFDYGALLKSLPSDAYRAIYAVRQVKGLSDRYDRYFRGRGYSKEQQYQASQLASMHRRMMQIVDQAAILGKNKTDVLRSKDLVKYAIPRSSQNYNLDYHFTIEIPAEFDPHGDGRSRSVTIYPRKSTPVDSNSKLLRDAGVTFDSEYEDHKDAWGMPRQAGINVYFSKKPTKGGVFRVNGVPVPVGERKDDLAGRLAKTQNEALDKRSFGEMRLDFGKAAPRAIEIIEAGEKMLRVDPGTITADRPYVDAEGFIVKREGRRNVFTIVFQRAGTFQVESVNDRSGAVTSKIVDVNSKGVQVR